MTVRSKRDFASAEDGGVTVMTLFMVIAMMWMVGIAIDLMRFETTRARLQSTMDRAVLAAADLDVCLDPDNDPRAVVEDYVAKNGFAGQVTNIVVTPGFNSCTVTADAAIDINTSIMKWLGIEKLGTQTDSGATESIEDVEISLVLDVSGSMAGTKIGQLRTAASEFVTTIFGAVDDDHLSMSLVPYSTHVNLGRELGSQYRRYYPHDYSYCIDLDDDSYYENREFPTGPKYVQAAHFDVRSGWNWNELVAPRLWNCNPDPGNAVVAFSNDETELVEHIEGLETDNWTSIELGARWGLTLLDPASNAVVDGMIADDYVSDEMAGRPLPYSEDSLKVMVVMTDGENTRDYVMATNRRDQDSDVWLDNQGNFDTTDDVFYVYDREEDDRDGDGNWRERWWVVNDGTMRSGNEYWSNDAYGERMTWQDIWAYMSVQSHAHELRFDQYNRQSVFDAWYDDIISINYWAEKDRRLAMVCDNAKEAGIIVYTIGFEVTDRAAEVMSACATSPNHFYRVEGLEIASAFNAIANQISSLRLFQ